jgi:hypothetical protein
LQTRVQEDEEQHWDAEPDSSENGDQVRGERLGLGVGYSWGELDCEVPPFVEDVVDCGVWA